MLWSRKRSGKEGSKADQSHNAPLKGIPALGDPKVKNRYKLVRNKDLSNSRSRSFLSCQPYSVIESKCVTQSVLDQKRPMEVSTMCVCCSPNERGVVNRSNVNIRSYRISYSISDDIESGKGGCHLKTLARRKDN